MTPEEVMDQVAQLPAAALVHLSNGPTAHPHDCRVCTTFALFRGHPDHCEAMDVLSAWHAECFNYGGRLAQDPTRCGMIYGMAVAIMRVRAPDHEAMNEARRVFDGALHPLDGEGYIDSGYFLPAVDALLSHPRGG